MKKGKIYTKRDFAVSLALLVVFLALRVFSHTGLDADAAGFWEWYVLSHFGLLFAPVLIIIGLYMCIERFAHMVLRPAPKPVPPMLCLHICLLSVCLACSCYYFTESAIRGGDNLFGLYRNLLGEEWVQWAEVFSGEALCWLLAILWCACQMCSLTARKGGKTGRAKIVLGWAKLVLLMCLICVLHDYYKFTANTHWRTLRDKDRIQYYELNGVENIMPYGLADKYFGEELRSGRPPQLQHYPTRRQKPHRRVLKGNHRIRYYVIRPYGQTKRDVRKTLYPPKSPHKRHFITERKNGSG